MAAGQPQVHTGCWPETSGCFLGGFFGQVTLPSGRLTRQLPPEESNERKKVRGQPERRATVSLLPNIRSDIHPIWQDCGTNSSPSSWLGHTGAWMPGDGDSCRGCLLNESWMQTVTIIIQIATLLLNTLDTYQSGFQGILTTFDLINHSLLFTMFFSNFCQHLSLQVFVLPLFGCCFYLLSQALVTLPNFKFSPYSLHQMSLIPGFMYH